MHPASAAAAARHHLDQVVSRGWDDQRRRIYASLAIAGLGLLLGWVALAAMEDVAPLAALLFLLPAGLVCTRLLVEVLLLLAARLIAPAPQPVAAPQPAGGLSWPPVSLVLAGPCGGQERPPRPARA